MKYRDLCEMAKACRLCPGMSFGRTFLNEYNGPERCDIMFIGEATNVGTDDMLPRPFSDSPSGSNFDHLLSSCGIERNDVFVTNTVLHTPITSSGQMRYVSETEQASCSSFLFRQIEIINPLLICTLGNRAFEGLKILYRENILDHRVKEVIGTPLSLRDGRKLMALYHPSPNVITKWRTMKQQEEDYSKVKILLDKLRSQRECLSIR